MWTKWVTRVGVAVGASVSAMYVVDQKKKYAFSAEKLYEEDILSPPYSPHYKWNKNWDMRQPESLLHPSKQKAEGAADELKKLKSKATRHLIFIRHGQYNMTEVRESRVLTKLGREQADFTGKRLKELKHQYSYMTHSTMVRAKETADVIAQSLSKDLDRRSDSMLEEGAPCLPEPPSKNWKPTAYFFTDGARIEAAFRKYFHRAPSTQEHDSYEVIVCHGNVIRYFLCRILQLPPEAWLRFMVAHGSISWFTIRPNGNVVVRHVGDIGHIPVEKVTYY